MLSVCESLGAAVCPPLSLSLNFKCSPGLPLPQGRECRWLSGAQKDAFSDVLTQMVSSTVTKVVPATLCSVPAISVLFA